MITDASGFRPLRPHRLVAAGGGAAPGGPGTRFGAGELVEETSETRTGVLQLVQLAESNR